MKSKTRYAAALILAANLSFSPIANAGDITLCTTTITVSFWQHAICSGAVGGIVLGCSAPVDGGVLCASSITTAAIACGISVESLGYIVKNCFF
jgi:hypothetical protein